MNSPMIFQFPDKTVSYDEFVDDLAFKQAMYLNKLAQHKSGISQNQAWKEFTKSKVQNWVKRGLIFPVKVGKQKLEYSYAKLLELNRTETLAL